MPSSGGSSRATSLMSPALVGRFFTTSATWKAQWDSQQSREKYLKIYVHKAENLCAHQ